MLSAQVKGEYLQLIDSTFFSLDDWFDAGSLGCFKFLEGKVHSKYIKCMFWFNQDYTIKVNLTWVEAQLACEQQGGFLAEPTSSL